MTPLATSGGKSLSKGSPNMTKPAVASGYKVLMSSAEESSTGSDSSSDYGESNERTAEPPFELQSDWSVIFTDDNNTTDDVRSTSSSEADHDVDVISSISDQETDGPDGPDGHRYREGGAQEDQSASQSTLRDNTQESEHGYSLPDPLLSSLRQSAQLYSIPSPLLTEIAKDQSVWQADSSQDGKLLLHRAGVTLSFAAKHPEKPGKNWAKYLTIGGLVLTSLLGGYFIPAWGNSPVSHYDRVKHKMEQCPNWQCFNGLKSELISSGGWDDSKSQTLLREDLSDWFALHKDDPDAPTRSTPNYSLFVQDLTNAAKSMQSQLSQYWGQLGQTSIKFSKEAVKETRQILHSAARGAQHVYHHNSDFVHKAKGTANATCAAMKYTSARILHEVRGVSDSKLVANAGCFIANAKAVAIHDATTMKNWMLWALETHGQRTEWLAKTSYVALASHSRVFTSYVKKEVGGRVDWGHLREATNDAVTSAASGANILADSVISSLGEQWHTVWRSYASSHKHSAGTLESKAAQISAELRAAQEKVLKTLIPAVKTSALGARKLVTQFNDFFSS